MIALKHKKNRHLFMAVVSMVAVLLLLYFCYYHVTHNQPTNAFVDAVLLLLFVFRTIRYTLAYKRTCKTNAF